MSVTLVLVLGLVGAYAKPEAPYLPPSGAAPFRNGALFQGAAQHVAGYPTGSATYNQNQYQPQPSYQQNSLNQYQTSGGGFNQPTGGGYNEPTGGFNQHTGGFNQNGFNGGFQTAGYADQAGFGPQSTDVFKSLYYFDSPEDIEVPAPRFSYAGGSKNSKHYKVIFIKAPAYVQKPITDIQANFGGQGDGKTIIYVLSKKPEAQQDVVINTAAAAQAVSKPEVYYIKYNSKADAEHQISQTLNGNTAGGAIPAKPLSSDHEFVSNIRDNIDVRSQGPIVKNLGGGQVHTAPQGGAQILGFNHGGQSGYGASSSQSNGGQSGYGASSSQASFSTSAPNGNGAYISHSGYSTATPNGYGQTDSYGNPRS